MEKIQGIYKIRNCINGKVYIGQSIDITRRFKDHKSNTIYTHNIPVYNSFKKYGINNFEFIIIEEVSNVLLLDEREQYWMDYYKSYDRDYGYNIRLDCRSNRGIKASDETRRKIGEGHKGIKHSDEARRKNSESHKGILKPVRSLKHRYNLSKSHKGKKHSEETKLKMSLSRKGRIVSEETRRKISLSHIGKIGYKHTEKAKLKIGESSRTRKRNPVSTETKLKISKGIKQYYLLKRVS